MAQRSHPARQTVPDTGAGDRKGLCSNCGQMVDRTVPYVMRNFAVKLMSAVHARNIGLKTMKQKNESYNTVFVTCGQRVLRRTYD